MSTAVDGAEGATRPEPVRAEDMPRLSIPKRFGQAGYVWWAGSRTWLGTIPCNLEDLTRH